MMHQPPPPQQASYEAGQAAAATTPDTLADLPRFVRTLPSERRVYGRFPVTLTRQDLIVLTVVMLLFPFTTASMSLAGSSAWAYFALAFGVFLVPSAVVTAKLSRMYPKEGAFYVWVFKAFGNGWDTLLGFFSTWWPPILLTVALPFTIPQLFQGLGAIWGQTWSLVPWQQSVIFLAVLFPIWGLACLPLARLIKLLKSFLYLYLAIIGLMGLMALIWLAHGSSSQTNLFSQPHFESDYWIYFEFAVLGCLGIQLPMNLSAETRGPQARAYTSWSAWLVIIGYLVMWFAIAVILPQDPTNPLAAVNVGNFPEVFTIVLGASLPGQLLATLANLVLSVLIILQGSIFMLLLSRLIVVAALDRRLPQRLATVDQNGVPQAALKLQFAFTVVCTLIITIIASLSSDPNFGVVLFNLIPAAALCPWTLTSLTLFVVGAVLLARESHAAHRAGGPSNMVTVVCCILGSLASLATLLLIILVPWTPSIDQLNWTFWIGFLVLGPLAIGAVYSFVFAPEPSEIWLRFLLAKQRKQHTTRASGNERSISEPTSVRRSR